MTAGCRQTLGMKNPLATQAIQINFRENPLTSSLANLQQVGR